MATTQQERTERLEELIDGIDFTMLTTHGDGASMHARPMAVQGVEGPNRCWLFTSRRSGKVDEIAHDHEVCLSFADPDSQHYVSASGHAQVVDDHAKARELWSPMAKAWFDGPDDPDLVLLRVDLDRAEYWDTPTGGKLVQFAGMAKAALTGDEPDASAGENERVDLR